MATFQKPFEEKLYKLYMQAYDDTYDPGVRMCVTYRGKNGYHSKLSNCMVHDVRASFSGACDPAAEAGCNGCLSQRREPVPG